MVLNWGKPKIEIKKEGESSWTVLPTPVENTTQLETNAGDKTDATEEGGGIVDTYRKKSKYSLSFELFVKKTSTKPIEDEDGVINDNYSIRLTPEDPTCHGYIIEKASVSLEETYTAQDGGRWKYVFDALVPGEGKKMLDKYTAQTGTAQQ